ncbi:trans-aconitate 2-methyltransferase [Parafrankia sp. CH37]|uniref:class I SAM-dependent methyltransferase n=1 Tax=Parafrankia sp. CH37 TaxID=683308 RepID=UPI001866A161|nr:class I SAM-dependent methyltransferase [Parafrankia sp. CH37]MBE3202545.1 methyltransferase domain-containing protein [Parafrankia sp. CH37]
MFRAKDKTEELCEIILGYYDDPNELAVVAAEDLRGFDAASFASQARPSYRDAVMSMCLVRSPIDLISSLLGPREVIREIRHRQLDQAREFDSPQARARLLARGLGFTVSDAPGGHSIYQGAVTSARSVAGMDSAPAETLRGAGLSLAQNVERMLFDLAHFWASVLVGSMTDLIREYNASNLRRPLQAQRLTGGQLAALLRYLNRGGNDVVYTLGLLLTRRSRPFSSSFLAAVDTFVATRNDFVHEHRNEGRVALQQRFNQLLNDADLVVGRAGESYPVVVKLTEIMFDEFGRQIYSATDTEGRILRFTLTRDEEEKISISSHYFMLPTEPTAIDPVLVPRFVMDAGVLFQEAEGYRQYSDTQRSQSTKLLDRIDLSTRERALDVGCGSGRVTLDLADQYPNLQVHGIDISAEMIAVARRAARGHGNVTFYEADVLKYRTEQAYDAVFSNSTMHWVLPKEAGYGALFRLLAPGGLLAVHQGGDQTYAGLHECAYEVIESLNLASFFKGWRYPAHYPTRVQIEELLGKTGFADVEVFSDETDRQEHPTLVRDFSYAGLLPFLRQIPEERRELLRNEFLRHAERSQPSLYQHRLYITARRP